jgi:hypothetical protein
MVFTPTITLFEQIRLPFEFYISNADRGFRQPFNQFGVSPRLFGWLTLHAGYYSAQLSELTFGDSRILGGGVEMTPGQFRFSAIYGRVQKAIQTDTVAGIRGVYDRMIYGGRIGYGRDNGFHVDLNVFHAVDDSTSMHNPIRGKASDSVVSQLSVAPMENLVASLDYGFSLFDQMIQFSGETAVSALSNDITASEIGGVPSSVEKFFVPRYSTQIDGATSMAITVTPSSIFSVRLNGKWVGPGFVSLGYTAMPNDVLETTIAPTLRLFDGVLGLRGSFGLRYNNLRNNRIATTQRTIGSVNATVQASQSFGVDVQYSNYGMSSNQRNDTLRINNVSQSFSVSPRYTFEGLGGVNTTMLSYSLQDYTDLNVVTSKTSQNTTQTVLGVWTLALPSSLSFSTMLMFTNASTSVIKTQIGSVNETVGYSFFDNALTTSGTVGYNVVKVNASDGQFNGRISASYNTKGWGTFSLTLMSNRYNFGDPASGSPYSEYQGSLSYGIAF